MPQRLSRSLKKLLKYLNQTLKKHFLNLLCTVEFYEALQLEIRLLNFKVFEKI